MLCCISAWFTVGRSAGSQRPSKRSIAELVIQKQTYRKQAPVRYRSVEKHLQPYVILSRRRTTINHAFASAIAPFDDGRIREAVETLGQDPDADLRCAYCDKQAETWDHVFATVRDSRFSGHGHRLGNLLPCCKACNSAKGKGLADIYCNSVMRRRGCAKADGSSRSLPIEIRCC